jgi:hypothetical protein
VEDPVLKDPVQLLNASIQPEITSLQVQTSVWNAVTVESDQQTIFIDANDQRGKTLNKAAGNAIIDRPNESLKRSGLSQTTAPVRSSTYHLRTNHPEIRSILKYTVNIKKVYPAIQSRRSGFDISH